MKRIAGRRLLKALAKSNPSLTFVQIGANDGEMMDPINKSILASNWRGWALEPVPQIFEQLQENYRGISDRVKTVNIAIAESAGEKPFYFLSNKEGLPDLPSWARGLGSFKKEVVVSHGDRIQGIQAHLCEIEVPCLDWQAFCDQYHVKNLDLLVMDTEGYDFEIIKQLDFISSRPLVIVYEHHHFDDRTKKACKELLASSGYRLFKEGLDTWAIDQRCSNSRYADVINKVPHWVRQSPYAQFC